MNSLILTVVALATTTTTCVAQQQSVYTFQSAGEGESWIQYKPTWSSTQQPRFDFSLRTKRANSFVFSMSFAPAGDELTLWGSLKNGELHVTLNAGGDESKVKAGKGKPVNLHDSSMMIVVVTEVESTEMNSAGQAVDGPKLWQSMGVIKNL